MGRCRTHCVEQVGEVLRDFPVASFSLDVSLIFVTKLTNPNKSQLSTSRAIIKYCSIDLVQGGELLCTYIINSSSARIRNRGDLRHETPSLRFTIGSGTRHHRSIFSFESTSSIFSNLDLMVKQTPGKVYVLPTVTWSNQKQYFALVACDHWKQMWVLSYNLYKVPRQLLAFSTCWSLDLSEWVIFGAAIRRDVTSDSKIGGQQSSQSAAATNGSKCNF